jgi:hypothetical protein
VAGIAAGVAIGLVALVAGTIFVWRRKRNMHLHRSGNDRFDAEHAYYDKHSQGKSPSEHSGRFLRDKKVEDLPSIALSAQEDRNTSSSSHSPGSDIYKELSQGSSQGSTLQYRHEGSQQPSSDFLPSAHPKKQTPSGS